MNDEYSNAFEEGVSAKDSPEVLGVSGNDKKEKIMVEKKPTSKPAPKRRKGTRSANDDG